MICRHCGATNDNHAQFCYSCGTRLEEGAPTIRIATAPSAMPPSPSWDQKLAAQASQPIQPYSYTSVPLPTNNMAIASLILGIVSWVFPFLLFAIGAVFCGHLARNEIRRSGGQLGGDGFALAGLILGYLQIGLYVIAFCLFIGFFFLVALL